MSIKGLVGALVFAIGGAILFASLFEFGRYVSGRTGMLSAQSFAVFGFFGFLILGIGLWLIVQDGKPELKQTH